MKLNIELDLEQVVLWDSDYSLEESVKKNLKREIVRDISDRIRDKVAESIERECREYIDKTFSSMVTAYFKDFIQNNKIEMSGNEGTMLMGDWIRQYLRDKLRGYCYGGFDATLKKVAEEFTKELKQAYDMKFASLIVKNMAEANLLKEKELAKLIEK